MKAPYCPKGTRRCSVTKKCVKKARSRSSKCKKGSRKCSDTKCYKKRKSVKSRANFYEKYVSLK